VPGRYFQVRKYALDGSFGNLMTVDQSGNCSVSGTVSASASSANTCAVVGQANNPNGACGGLFQYGSDGNNAAYLGGNGNAAVFYGTVHVNGTLTKSGGSFRIDHPLDPANKYLSHSFVESPDMKNIYDGVVTTDANGDAVVALPVWFEALNRDFRYQLTPIGQFAQAIVAEEVRSNSFAIKTDKPNVKVSWQITGIRHDAWANAHRIPVEEDKPAVERGTYLAPEELGQPKDKSVQRARHHASAAANQNASVPASVTGPANP
jgi:hypothetical protein